VRIDLPAPLIFLRHGETDWNVEGRLQGQRDIPLNVTGRGQARRNGEAILRAFPDIAGFDAVASPLGRTRATMEIARGAMGLDPAVYRTDDRLLEITFGAWEGATLDELRAIEPGRIAERERDKWDFVPPGGESYARITRRVGAWLAEVQRPTFAVSHGGVGRVLRHLVLGIDPAEAAGLPFPQDRALVIREGRGEWV
jgi:probable phosphoglycerate mutase